MSYIKNVGIQRKVSVEIRKINSTNNIDCIRCPSKAPDPEKRYQVEEKLRNAEERFAYYEREGLVLEAEKMRQLIRNCHLELREMSQITAYRKDQTRVIQMEPRPKRPS